MESRSTINASHFPPPADSRQPRAPPIRIFRTELHGHIIEARQGDLGRQRVLVDGRIASDKPFAGLLRPSHFFEIADADGRTRRVELLWIDESKLGLGRYRVLVIVDGIERARLAPVDLSKPPLICRHCGYSLEKLPVAQGEIRCPECGRHTPASPARAAADDAGSSRPSSPGSGAGAG